MITYISDFSSIILAFICIVAIECYIATTDRPNINVIKYTKAHVFEGEDYGDITLGLKLSSPQVMTANTVIIGSSEAALGINSNYLANALGVSVYNLGIVKNASAALGANLAKYIYENNKNLEHLILTFFPYPRDLTYNNEQAEYFQRKFINPTKVLYSMPSQSYKAYIREKILAIDNLSSKVQTSLSSMSNYLFHTTPHTISSLKELFYEESGSLTSNIAHGSNFKFCGYNPKLFEDKESELYFLSNFELVYEAVKDFKVKITFVINPVHKEFPANPTKLQEQIQQLPNTHHIINNSKLDFKKSLYRDCAHLNKNGAMRYTKHLTRALIAQREHK